MPHQNDFGGSVRTEYGHLLRTVYPNTGVKPLFLLRDGHLPHRMFEAMGGKVVGKLPGKDKDFGLKLGGEIIHEAGTTRMGTSPRTSVLNEWCQAHDCKNLFVASDGV